MKKEELVAKGPPGAAEAGQGVQGEGDSLGGRFGQHGKRIRPEG